MLCTSLLTITAFGLLAIAGRTLAAGPAPVPLGSDINFVILAETGISVVPHCMINGNVGVSPATGTSLVGFALTRSGTFSTSTQVTGEIFAADYTIPTPATLAKAIADMITAYNNAQGRLSPDFLNLGAGSIGGMTLTPGLYKWTTGLNVPSSITISGSSNDTWIFQVAGTINLASEVIITLSNGAKAHNIWWASTGAVAIGSAAHFEGVLLAANAITLNTGASLTGRILCQTHVSLQLATVNPPPP